MMQFSFRCLLRHLKSVNYSVYNSILYTYFFKKETLRNKLYSIPKNLYSPRYVLINQHQSTKPLTFILRYFTTASPSVPLKIKSVSSLEDLKNYINEEKQFYLKLLANILHNIRFGRYNNYVNILMFCV